MKKKFQHFISLEHQALDHIWENAIIALDASSLLQLYRYQIESRETFVKTLSHDKVKNRLWLPYQAASEFFENKGTVINEQANSKEKMRAILDVAIKDIEKQFRDNHSYISKKNVIKKLEEARETIMNEIAVEASKYDQSIKNDVILLDILKLFENKVGEISNESDLKDLRLEADKRYAEKIPPGYEDISKDTTPNSKYGDFYIWNELILKAKTDKLPVIFVIEERKEDWWSIDSGKIIGIRHELRHEFLLKTDQEIILCSMETFTKHAKNYFKVPNQDKLLADIASLKDHKKYRMENFSENIYKVLQSSKEDMYFELKDKINNFLKIHMLNEKKMERIKQQIRELSKKSNDSFNYKEILILERELNRLKEEMNKFNKLIFLMRKSEKNYDYRFKDKLNEIDELEIFRYLLKESNSN